MTEIRNFLIWVFGTAGAFLVTAGAFLLLANLGSSASERSLEPRPTSSDIQLPLELRMNKNQLKSLQPLRDQELTIVVSNGSDNSFSKVSLTLRVSSEDTALTGSRYYRAKVNGLKAGESRTVQFPINLSPLSDLQRETYLPGNQNRSRAVLEVQATTPEGISTVKTAVLPFPEASIGDGNST